MKFNYEFEFDVDEFANWIEEHFFEIVNNNEGNFNEGFDKNWIEDKLYNWCCDENCPRDLILQYDMDNQTKRYYPQIVDEAYEILKKKYKEMKEFNEDEELKAHVKAIGEYCENRATCNDCPLNKYCCEPFDHWF